MYNHFSIMRALGIVFAFVLLGSLFVGQNQAVADPKDYASTLTPGDTVKVAAVGDSVEFYVNLENTGSNPDSFLVTLTENPPTPEEWWVKLCAGGACWDTTVTSANSYLEFGWVDSIQVHIKVRMAGKGSFTITTESYGNPADVKSVTFLLNVHEQGPVTNQWGIIVLTLLIITSAIYLMLKRYRLARQMSR
jgi:hypothetical protein